uniref:Uncharacterized protein n=1 Tax=Sinocyclocheilus grahami TaxID=75366 RepID=A0A672JZQ4_SINGR
MSSHLFSIRSLKRFKKRFLSFIKEDAVDLCGVADFIKRNRDSTIPLVKPRGATLRICGQHGTVYEGDEEQLEAWKDYYLPERMEMEVIGAIDDFPCDAFGLQLVLLLGEDGRVFAYEDELLHLVALNLRDLFQHGMVFPGKETFKLGECFEEPVRSCANNHLYIYVLFNISSLCNDQSTEGERSENPSAVYLQSDPNIQTIIQDTDLT